MMNIILPTSSKQLFRQNLMVDDHKKLHIPGLDIANNGIYKKHFWSMNEILLKKLLKCSQVDEVCVNYHTDFYSYHNHRFITKSLKMRLDASIISANIKLIFIKIG